MTTRTLCIHDYIDKQRLWSAIRKELLEIKADPGEDEACEHVRLLPTQLRKKPAVIDVEISDWIIQGNLRGSGVAR